MPNTTFKIRRLSIVSLIFSTTNVKKICLNLCSINYHIYIYAPPHQNFRKQIQQVIKLKILIYVMLLN